MNNDIDIERFKRQVLLPEIGISGQQKLKDAHVLVVGAGGLGNIVCAYLAAVGIGEITIIDHDVVDVSNLQRQVLFTEKDLGLPKAEQLSMRLNALNSSGTYHFINQKINVDNRVELFENKDVIVDCVDQISVRYLLNDVAVFQKVPLVYGAIHRFEGQVALFNYEGGATYRCAFPEAKTNTAVAPNCEENGVIGILPGIIGLYQAMEVIKVVTGIGKPLKNELLMIDVLQATQQKIKLKPIINAINQALQNIQSTKNKQEIEGVELAQFVQGHPSLQIVDIQEELATKELFNTPVIHIPDYVFMDKVNELSAAHPILVYCSKGIKSQWALEVLKSQGYTNTFQLSGGYASITNILDEKR